MQQDNLESQLKIYQTQVDQYNKLLQCIQDDTNYFSETSVEDQPYYYQYETYKSQVEQKTFDASAYQAAGYTDAQIKTMMEQNQSEIQALYYSTMQSISQSITSAQSNVAFNFQWNQSEVTSSGFNQIEVNKDYALDITINPDETPDEDQKDDKNYDLNQSVKDPRYNGSDAYLDYTVTLVVQNEQAGPLTLADSMTLPTGVTAEYVENSLRLSMENGNTTPGITWEDDNGERKITLASAGSPIAAGTYSICYTVKLKDVGETAVDGVINNIKILDTSISDDAEKSVKTDSLVITSQADPSDYELPSTGGAGTKLYTAGGGALMLAALVCGVCRKHRRERRAR